MQSQPNSELDWKQLCWAYRTIDLLPLLEEEVDWAENVSIPAFFTLAETNQEIAVSALYDMVAIFFFNI